MKPAGTSSDASSTFNAFSPLSIAARSERTRAGTAGAVLLISVAKSGIRRSARSSATVRFSAASRYASSAFSVVGGLLVVEARY